MLRLNDIFLTAAALFALSGCATTGAAQNSGNSVALGQIANVDGPHIRPIAGLEDSRCPINARCIWAGRVRLKALWVRPQGNQEIELTLGEAKPLADGSITLTDVRPQPITSKKIRPRDYRFSFEFAGGI